MCGLLGICSANNRQVNLDWITIGKKTLIHRGPNSSGEWRSNDGCVGMGHQRLSIIDLTSSGHQPMHNEGQDLTIVFNGEIYNHHILKKELSILGYKFRSNSDTEVLLAAYSIWGKNCLSKLNGMFVFAIYDQRIKKLFVARDRAGEKPFFYHYSNGVFRYSSELKAFFVDQSISKNLNVDALNCYLALGYTPSDLSMVEGFKKLPPAHALEFDLKNNNLKIWRYWKPEKKKFKSELNNYHEKKLLDNLEYLLNDSVSKQLVADVPTGVLLSGGLDSSLLVAFAAKNSTKPLDTFNVSIPGNHHADESEHALLISNHFNTNHHVLKAKDEDAVEVMTKLSHQFDDPIADSSMIPTYMVSSLVSNHCSVVLGGDGGDELFGGYSHFTEMLKMEKYFRYIPDFLINSIIYTAQNILPAGFKGRSFLQRINFKKDFSPYFDTTLRNQLLINYQDYNSIFNQTKNEHVSNIDIIYKATLKDFLNYLPNDILVKVDRSSMANSLEIRAPFLDYRIIEFAFNQLPSNQKVSESENKIFLKKLAKKILPDEFDYNRKQGFSVPIKSWLEKGPFRELVWSVLTDKKCMFNPKMINTLLQSQDRGYNNSERLFSLTIFEMWRSEYEINDFK